MTFIKDKVNASCVIVCIYAQVNNLTFNCAKKVKIATR